MTSQAPTQPQQLVLPTLYALLPPPNYTRLISRLSLLAIHVSPYTVRDDMYHPTNTVLPQPRTLRVRASRKYSSTVSKKGKEKAVVIEEGDDEHWHYDLSYLSALMNASEYRDMEVRAYLGVEVIDPHSRKNIEAFLDAMDFKRSHHYTRSGLVFHLPTPLMLLHLTITRLHHDTDTQPGAQTTEPFLVQLEPSRPTPSQPTRNEPVAADVMSVMRDFTGRLEGLYWSTGR